MASNQVQSKIDIHVSSSKSTSILNSGSQRKTFFHLGKLTRATRLVASRSIFLLAQHQILLVANWWTTASFGHWTTLGYITIIVII